MLYLIGIIVIGVFNCTLQNYYCKNLFKTRSDNFAYSIIMYLIAAAAVFVINGFKVGQLAAFTVLDSILYGTMMTLELYCTLQAFKCGSMSLTSLFILASVIVPVIPSWIFWGDPITWQQVSGMVILFIAIAMILKVGSDVKKSDINWKWFGYAFLAFIGSGMAAVAEKLLTQSEYAGQSNDFVFVGLLFAVAAMVITLLILKRKEPVTMRFTTRTTISTVISGAGSGALCILTMLAVASLPASVVYSVNNGMRIILLTVLDIVLFKEKIIKTQYIGLGLGILGVVLLSLG